LEIVIKAGRQPARNRTEILHIHLLLFGTLASLFVCKIEFKLHVQSSTSVSIPLLHWSIEFQLIGNATATTLLPQTLMIMPATILITHKIKGGKELRRQEFKFKPDDSVKRILLSLFSISFSVYFCGKKKKIII